MENMEGVDCEVPESLTSDPPTNTDTEIVEDDANVANEGDPVDETAAEDEGPDLYEPRSRRKREASDKAPAGSRPPRFDLSCPLIDQLYAWASGLGEPTTDQLAHILSCPKCYRFVVIQAAAPPDACTVPHQVLVADADNRPSSGGWKAHNPLLAKDTAAEFLTSAASWQTILSAIRQWRLP